MQSDLNLRAALQCELLADTARSFGRLQLQVTGGSMLPSIWPGDRLTVLRRHCWEFRPGQIILYLRDGGMVAHRVVSRECDLLITRGDSLPRVDLPVSQSEIVGEVVSIERGGEVVSPQLTLGRRMVAWLLRRWGFGVRLMIHFCRAEWAR